MPVYILTGVYSCTPDMYNVHEARKHIIYVTFLHVAHLAEAAQGQPRRLRHSQQSFCSHWMLQGEETEE